MGYKVHAKTNDVRATLVLPVAPAHIYILMLLLPQPAGVFQHFSHFSRLSVHAATSIKSALTAPFS